MAKAELKHVLLHCLAEEPLSGYGLMKRIKEESGTWKPSFGSIYPRLRKMEEEGFVTSKKEGRKVIYTLTKKGRAQAEQQQDQLHEATLHLIAKAKMLYTIDQEMADLQGELLQAFLEGKDPFQGVGKELIALKATLFSIYKKGRLKKHRKDISAILNKATEEMQALP